MEASRFFLSALTLGTALLLYSIAVVAEEREEGAATTMRSVPAYPGSMETLIDRRRDQLRRRRETYRDLISGRRWRQPPWENAMEDWMDQRQDAMAESIRMRRDALDARHDALARWYDPWSQMHRDWIDARKNRRDLDRLAREEYYDRTFYRAPRYGFHPYW